MAAAALPQTVRPHSSLGYRAPAPKTVLPNVDGPTYAIDGLRSLFSSARDQPPNENWTTQMGAG